LILHSPYGPVDWIAIPLGFTVAEVFTNIVFLIQNIILHKEREPAPTPAPNAT